MLELTTVISYKDGGGLYKMAEAFIYNSHNKDIKLIVIDSNGFTDALIRNNIQDNFMEYLFDMFGLDEFILIFIENDYIYLFERRQGQLFHTIKDRYGKNSSEAKKLFNELNYYFENGKTTSKKNKSS